MVIASSSRRTDRRARRGRSPGEQRPRGRWAPRRWRCPSSTRRRRTLSRGASRTSAPICATGSRRSGRNLLPAFRRGARPSARATCEPSFSTLCVRGRRPARAGDDRRGMVPGSHLGHVAHYIAHHTDRPVAIVPADSPPFGLRRVVIGVDGSSGSRAAVEFACQLGTAGSEAFTVVHAYLPRAEGGVRRDRGDWREETEWSCRAWAQPLEGRGQVLRTVVDEGEPSRLIAETARTEDAGFVVVGTRGRGALRGLRLGSVALEAAAALEPSRRPRPASRLTESPERRDRIARLLIEPVRPATSRGRASGREAPPWSPIRACQGRPSRTERRVDWEPDGPRNRRSGFAAPKVAATRFGDLVDIVANGRTSQTRAEPPCGPAPQRRLWASALRRRLSAARWQSGAPLSLTMSSSRRPPRARQ